MEHLLFLQEQKKGIIIPSNPSFIPDSPRAFFWDDILATPVQHDDVDAFVSILAKNIYYNCLTAVKKPTVTPGAARGG